jgi:4-hydroxy-4-methyl-2-oxoglutarate aldolase
VVVASVGGHYEAGYWGALMATSALARSLGGLAIDGCVRDSAEIIDMGFPVFCRGFCIRGTAKAILGLINYPTLFGGVLVNPGDLILGDDDGIVVIGRDECEPVLEQTLKRIDSEVEKSTQLRKGISSVEINKLDKVFKSLGLIES